MAISWNPLETISYVVKDIGGTHITVALGSSSENITLLDDTFAVGDSIMFVKYYRCDGANSFLYGSHPFSGLQFNLSEALIATGYTYIWEYRNDDVWAPLSDVIDDTNGLTTAGEQSVTWPMEDVWMSSGGFAGSDARGFIVRLRITGLVDVTQNAIQGNYEVKNYSHALLINDGNTYLVEDLYDTLMINGADSYCERSRDNKTYTFNTNIIVHDGELLIHDHERVLVGRDGYVTKSIELSSTNGTLTLGHLSAEDQGYRGGELIWYNANRSGTYLYWYGDFRCYASRMYIHDGDYYAVSHANYNEIIDSIIVRGTINEIVYMVGDSSGRVVRSSIQAYRFMVHSGDWTFDTLSLPPGEVGTRYGITAGGSSHTLYISGTDFGNSVYIQSTYRASVSLLDCINIDDSKLDVVNSYYNASLIAKEYTFKLTVADTNSLPMEGVKVQLLDMDHISGLFKNLRKSDDTEILGLDTLEDTNAIAHDVPADLVIGDLIYVHAEMMRVVDIGTDTLVVDRNQPGTYAQGLHTSPHEIYIVQDYIETTPTGELEYSGANGAFNYIILSELYWGVRTTVYESGDRKNNPFVLKLFKYGYNLGVSSTLLQINTPLSLNLTMYRNLSITELDEPTVRAYTGISVDIDNEEVTVSSSHTVAELYDYLQLYVCDNPPKSALMEIMSTVDGKAFDLASGWTLIFDSQVPEINLNGTIRILSNQNLSRVNVAQLEVDLSDDASIMITDSTIDEILNISSNILVVENGGSALGTTEPGTGPGEVDIISVNSFTVSNLQPHSEVRLYDSTLTEIGGIEDSATSVVFPYQGVYSDAVLVVYHVDYTPIREVVQLGASNQSFMVKQGLDRTYTNPS